MSSSEKYEILQDDVEGLFERVEASLDLTRKKKNPEEKRYWTNRARSELSEAQRLIHEMEVEARAAPLHYRSEMLTKVRQLRETSSRLQNETRILNDRLHGGAAAAASRTLDEPEVPVNDEDLYRQQVQQGAKILEKTSDSLIRSQRVAVETEAVGEAIITDLNHQREALERTRTMLHETDNELGQSRRILRRISMVTTHNKVVLIFVIVIQIGIIIALTYWKWFSHHT